MMMTTVHEYCVPALFIEEKTSFTCTHCFKLPTVSLGWASKTITVPVVAFTNSCMAGMGLISQNNHVDSKRLDEQ